MTPALPEGFPPQLWRRVEVLVAGALEDPQHICAEAVAWLEGRAADDLNQVLDALREVGAYPVSLALLEEAFNSDLPLDRLGRLAEDWIGTVLHGLGDRPGAETVAAHITPRAITLGGAFAGDLGHLLLQWDLIDAARPLVEYAARRMPGDLPLQFALGVVRKFEQDWAESRRAFERVVAQHPTEKAGWWNLGIVCVAQEDWAAARRAWAAVDLELPPGDPNADYGAAGTLTPVRLATGPGAPMPYEVVWGHRIGPARVQLAGLPRFPRDAGFGALVLIDGVPTGEAPYGEERRAIFPHLATIQPGQGQRFHLRAPLREAADRQRIRTLAQVLAGDGWPVADWTGLGGAQDRIELGLIVLPNRSPAEALAAVAHHGAELTLYAPELRLAAGQDPTEDAAQLRAEGL
jgi:tetratricopeptide (TPR) repeat protein